MPNSYVGVGADRRAVAAAVIGMHAIDVAVMDDGLQHGAVDRDLDIAMFNALDPVGNGSLLPEGIMREPLEGLHRAGVVVLHH